MVLRNNLPLIGLVFGILLFILFILSEAKGGLSRSAWLTLAVTVIMTVWWVTEAVPIYITGIVPLITFPLLNIFDIKEIAVAYAHPLVLLFLGGFIIAAAMESSGLHKRIALKILYFFGTSPSMIIAGFMFSTSVLSMWVSNTASTIMMLPIALSVISMISSEKKIVDKKFAIPLLLSIAYAASVGGTATLIGTPTNIMLASILNDNYNYQISFIDWFIIGFPVAMVLIPVIWFFMTKILFRVSNKNSRALEKTITNINKTIGKASFKEKVVAFIFILTAFFWIFRQLINDLLGTNLNDTSIGLLGALMLFIIPVNKNERACDWKTASKIPWGVLLVVGGGIALSKAFKSSGLADWVGSFSSFFYGVEIYLLILFFVFLIIFLTELNSNTATVATFSPILIVFALGLETNPLYFVIPTTIASSCAFMLPIATPPNAVIFGSGKISINDMIRPGIFLNIASAIIVTSLCFFILNLILQIDINTIPEWIK
ncbi:SLC13 family permease [Alphaproteobacteria bacterium]|nr:SLC13 family permease [Alphaproteobacteria bacterium]